MNPILPNNEYIPDPEARVWADRRLYLYGSRDQPGTEAYCSDRYKVFSTADLIDWTDHGESFRVPCPGFPAADTLYAPDCVYRDGRYFLFFCLPGGREGIAVSDSPAGPFTDASPVAGADRLGIDPAVLVDDDRAAYLYWGQFDLHVARLADDMRSILPETRRSGILNEHTHGFHEGASIRKVGGRYCLVYCDGARGRATSLSYALGDSPFGPFTRQGVIIDNTNADPLSWNIHGSLCQFKGQWYIFYHRSSGNSRYNRRACVEPVTIHPDGRIDEVAMSTQGAGPPLPASETIEAWRACQLYGRIHTRREDDREFLHSVGEGNIADFHAIHFQGETHLSATVRGRGECFLNVGSRFAAHSAKITVDSPTAWTTVQVPLRAPLEGTQSLHLYTLGGELDISRLAFGTD